MSAGVIRSPTTSAASCALARYLEVLDGHDGFLIIPGPSDEPYTTHTSGGPARQRHQRLLHLPTLTARALAPDACSQSSFSMWCLTMASGESSSPVTLT